MLATILGSNRVGVAGAEGMAAALAKSPALRELHLSGNSLGNAGVTTLVKGAVAGRRLRGDPTVDSVGTKAWNLIATQPR